MRRTHTTLHDLHSYPAVNTDRYDNVSSITSDKIGRGNAILFIYVSVPVVSASRLDSKPKESQGPTLLQ